jgi:membrane associated rhomboid family serine protease
MIPYNTDAPIYHWPAATVGLIIVNVLLFFTCDPFGYSVSVIDPSVAEIQNEESEFDEDMTFPTEEGLVRVRQTGPTLALEYGAVKPWQWLTSIFMHAGVMHVVFNMIFLWAFGLIVEGKVGHWVFLALYLAIGVGQSAIEQLIMLWASEGASLGASAAIAGLLGIVLVWAPRNDFDCWLRYSSIEVPVTVFAGLWLLQQVVFMFLSGSVNFGSEVLHLMGFTIGFAAGILWVVRGWVDCEGYDLIAVLKGTEGRLLENEADAAAVDKLLGRKPYRPKTSKSAGHAKSASHAKSDNRQQSVASSRKAVPAPAAKTTTGTGATPQTIRQQVTSLIQQGQIETAEKLFAKLARQDMSVQWTRDELVTLIKLAMQQKEYARAKPLLETLLENYPDNSDSARSTLARIYLHEQLPNRVLALYRDVNLALLDDKNQLLARQLISAAKKQQTIGPTS